ncbi:hypothetical protein BAAM0499_03650 [Bifidobacterium animalis subsp. animalis MCC 0499]|uniref:class C sortase n=1 Tax=Bifidobacterium animalis TaxID=28025 RepID=UPI00069A172F|nr:class C sortase [Bifidobacterium animalis]KOA60975.1 hypothetical protein BAAM0499_03650 [Bifidobacterium animalis subsp. animalis MCC 0499]
MDAHEEWERIVTGRDPARSRQSRRREQESRASKRRLIRMLTVIMVVCALVGAATFGWIMWERRQAQQEQTRAAASAIQADPRKDLSPVADEYNRQLAATPQIIGETMEDGETAGDFSFNTDTVYHDVLDYGDGVMGQLLIPAIGVDMPIRHGADGYALEHGVGHLHGTSLPVGGRDTHAVLTGHTGEADKALFSRLNELDTGDLFYVKTGARILAYRVEAVRTVLPKDTGSLKIQKGKDLVTLVTCTPIFLNTHRLLVTGVRQRIPDQAPWPEETIRQVSRQDSSSQAWRVMLVVLAVLLPCAVLWVKRHEPAHVAHRKWSRRDLR